MWLKKHVEVKTLKRHKIFEHNVINDVTINYVIGYVIDDDVVITKE